MAERLRLLILTPHEVVVEEEVDSARVPTETGHAGLRPREEPFVTAVEPGLILLRDGGATRFAATAGGLLEGDRDHAVVYTPFAAAGEEPEEVLHALDRALETPGSEIEARRRLGELEDRIVRELRRRPGPAGPTTPERA